MFQVTQIERIELISIGRTATIQTVATRAGMQVTATLDDATVEEKFTRSITSVKVDVSWNEADKLQESYGRFADGLGKLKLCMGMALERDDASRVEGWNA
jgi:hypothetical protein